MDSLSGGYWVVGGIGEPLGLQVGGRNRAWTSEIYWIGLDWTAEVDSRSGGNTLGERKRTLTSDWIGLDQGGLDC